MYYKPEDFIEKLLRKSKKIGFVQSEALYTDSRSVELHVLEGDVSQFEASTLSGLSFRGVYQGKMGYAYTESMDDESLDFILEQAKQNAGILEEEVQESIYEGEKKYRKISNYSSTLENTGYEDLAGLTLSLEKEILDFDKRIIAVDHCISSFASGSEIIENTLGMKLSDKSNMLFIYADVRCQENDQIKTAAGYWYGREKDKMDIGSLAKEIAEKALKKLGARSIPTGKYKAVLDREVVCDILDTFSGIFSADAIQKGFSLLGDKLNSKIAGTNITIRDDAFADGSITKTAYDSEGVSTRNISLIENGILMNLLHNRKTAKKDGVASTGNGFRGYKSSLSIGTKNYYLVPGDCHFEDLIKEMKNGVYITEVSGLHSGADPISGDFSLLGEGFLVENGIITSPIEQITIADNFYDLINKIENVGNDLLFQAPSGAGSTGSPSVFIHEIAVSGE